MHLESRAQVFRSEQKTNFKVSDKSIRYSLTHYSCQLHGSLKVQVTADRRQKTAKQMKEKGLRPDLRIPPPKSAPHTYHIYVFAKGLLSRSR